MKAETVAALQDARTKRRARGACYAAERCRRDPGLSGQGGRRASQRSGPGRPPPRHGDRRSETVDIGGEIFLNVYVPPARLIIVGAVHIAQSLAPMAAMLDFDVTVVDPRGAWATGSRSRREGDAGMGRRCLRDDGSRRLDRRGDLDARSQARRSRARGGAEVRCLLCRRAGQPAHSRQAQGAAGRSRHHRRAVRPHPWSGRPQYRRQVAGRDRSYLGQIVEVRARRLEALAGPKVVAAWNSARRPSTRPPAPSWRIAGARAA